MLKSAAIRDVLDRMAHNFESQVEEVTTKDVPVEEIPDCSEFRAWGQFLGVEKRYHQIGLYGTASGLIVLQLADRHNSTVVTQALKTLQFWWEQRHATERQPGQWFLQTLRVAYLYMALGCLENDEGEALRQEVAQRLWGTQLPGGQWGHYWESKEEHDQTPRVLTTAVVIISFFIFSKANSETRQRLKKAAEWLESKVISGIELAPLPRIAAITALVAISGGRVNKDVQNAASRIARRADPELGDLEVYFCDFRYHSGGSLNWERDYFIVPKATLLAIGGFLPNAPTFLRLRAERILDALVRKLKQSDFLYKPEPDRAAASKDNAWLALLLRLADQSHQTLSLKMRLVYHLLRERGPSVWLDRVFPVMSILMITALTAVARDVDLLSSLGTLIVGWLCMPQILELFRRPR